MIFVRQETARDRPGRYAEAPNFHLHGNSDDDQVGHDFRIKVKLFRAVVRAGWSRQEALISLRDA